jgi:hypothetical protein
VRIDFRSSAGCVNLTVETPAVTTFHEIVSLNHFTAGKSLNE